MQKKDILLILKTRFGMEASDIAPLLQAFKEGQKLEPLLVYAISCPSLEAFRTRLLSQTPSDTNV